MEIIILLKLMFSRQMKSLLWLNKEQRNRIQLVNQTKRKQHKQLKSGIISNLIKKELNLRLRILKIVKSLVFFQQNHRIFHLIRYPISFKIPTIPLSELKITCYMLIPTPLTTTPTIKPLI